MPTYCFKCPFCGEQYTRYLSNEELHDKIENGEILCYSCGTPMKRDFKEENVSNNFHPSRDLYAEKLKQKPRTLKDSI